MFPNNRRVRIFLRDPCNRSCFCIAISLRYRGLKNIHKHIFIKYLLCGEGNGCPLQYSCLGNPMDRGVWWAAVHGTARESDTAWPPNNNIMSLDLSFQRGSGKPLQVIFTSDVAYCTSNCVPIAHAMSFKAFLCTSEDFPHTTLLTPDGAVVKTLCFQCRGFRFNSWSEN